MLEQLLLSNLHPDPDMFIMVALTVAAEKLDPKASSPAAQESVIDWIQQLVTGRSHP